MPDINEKQRIEAKLSTLEMKKKTSTSAIGSIGIGLFLAVIGYGLGDLYSSLLLTAFGLAGLVFVLIGIFLLLYQYLQFGTDRLLASNKPSIDIQDLWLEVEKLRLDLKKSKKDGFDSESEKLGETVNQIITSTLTEEFLQNRVDDALSESAIKRSKTKQIYADFETLSYRIEDELSRLRRSANLNLVIGTLATTLAIAALGYEVFSSEFKFTETVVLLSHYVPRLSLVVFIEIFAFFFLKLYKTNLDDIKYFSNEKTNIEFKLIALRTAVQSENSELIASIVEELVKTERNFKLAKDESTVELEKIKSQNENNKVITQLLGKLSEKI